MDTNNAGTRFKATVCLHDMSGRHCFLTNVQDFNFSALEEDWTSVDMPCALQSTILLILTRSIVWRVNRVIKRCIMTGSV